MSTEDRRNYPVNPNEIDASKHLFDAFDNMQTEVSAGYIIRMLQEKGTWEPFTQEEIEKFYRKSGHTDGFLFNALIVPVTEHLFDGRPHTFGGGWIVQRPDGKFEVTEKFVRKAFEASPKK